MKDSIRKTVLSVLVGSLFQVVVSGCSSQSPMEPTNNSLNTATVAAGRPSITQVVDANVGTQHHQGANDVRTAVDVGVRDFRDEVETVIDFTGLIVGFDVEAQTIRLMEMQGTFKTWTGQVTENSELLGLEGETVTLADFGVCSQAIVRGEQTGESEFTINYLRMKNF